MGYGFVVCGLWFVVVVCGSHRKIRLTQLWVELSWVVAIENNGQLCLGGVIAVIAVSGMGWMCDCVDTNCFYPSFGSLTKGQPKLVNICNILFYLTIFQKLKISYISFLFSFKCNFIKLPQPNSRHYI